MRQTRWVVLSEWDENIATEARLEQVQSIYEKAAQVQPLELEAGSLYMPLLAIRLESLGLLSDVNAKVHEIDATGKEQRPYVPTLERISLNEMLGQNPGFSSE